VGRKQQQLPLARIPASIARCRYHTTVLLPRLISRPAMCASGKRLSAGCLEGVPYTRFQLFRV